MQFDADSRLQQPKGVFDSFVAERVEFHGGQVGRRQTGEVGSPGRRSVNGHVRIFGTGIRPAEIVLPRQDGVRAVPQGGVDEVRHRDRRQAVVEFRDFEELEGHGHNALVTGFEDSACGQSTACALPSNCDAAWIDPQLLGMGVDVEECGVAVVDGAGEGGFGGEAVLHVRNGESEFPRHLDAKWIAGFCGADCESAAMDPEQNGDRAGSVVRGEETNRDLRIAVQAGCRQFTKRDSVE